MSLNVENREAQQMAQELARLTGKSITDAVTDAIRQELKRVPESRISLLASELARVGNDCAGRLREPFRSIDHGHTLYDDKGLPR